MGPYQVVNPRGLKPILPNGILPKNPTIAEESAYFTQQLQEFFKDCGEKKTYVIIGIYTEIDPHTKQTISGYNEGLFAVRASSRELAEHTAHAMYVTGPNMAVKAMTPGELHAKNMDYLIMQSMRGKVMDADQMFQTVKERYVFDGTETGPIPGTPDTFPNAVGTVFYSTKKDDKPNDDDNEGGRHVRRSPKPRRV